jgi:NAD(P)-dependent dehydrogenase (short-subunit alcohol dehydrogenase family)
LTARRGARSCELVAEEIRSAGGSALAVAAPVSEFAAVPGMLAGVLDAWGHVDGLVKNAGFSRENVCEDGP